MKPHMDGFLATTRQTRRKEKGRAGRFVNDTKRKKTKNDKMRHQSPRLRPSGLLR